MKPGRERLERRVVLEQIGPIRPHALVTEQLARLVRVRVRVIGFKLGLGLGLGLELGFG